MPLLLHPTALRESHFSKTISTPRAHYYQRQGPELTRRTQMVAKENLAYLSELVVAGDIEPVRTLLQQIEKQQMLETIVRVAAFNDAELDLLTKVFKSDNEEMSK